MGLYTIAVYLYFIRQPEQLASAALRHERLRNGAYTTGQTNLFWFTSPATPESCDFLHQIKIGEWIPQTLSVCVTTHSTSVFSNSCTGIRLLDSGRWGDHASRTRTLSGFVDYLCESVGREHTPARVMPQSNTLTPLRLVEPGIRVAKVV